jgi:predicted nucleic acid-binding protein
MKIFVDTNIFLDIAFERANASDGLMIFKAIKNQIFDGVIADISIINIDYISKKVNGDISAYLKSIESNFTIIGADNTIISKALKIENNDLEDNIQYLLALRSSCDYIITNDKGFYRGEIETMSSSSFVNKFLIK